MFNKLKDALIKNNDQESQMQRKKSIDISFLNPDEIKQYKKTLNEVKLNIEELSDISKTNKLDIVAFIKEQQAKKEGTKKEGTNKSQDDEENFTFGEDLQEIKALLNDVLAKMSKVQQTQQEIKQKAKSFNANESPEKTKELQAIISKYEAEIKSLKTSQQNNKQIFNTLKQQTGLFSKETKDLQQKNMKLQKQLNEKIHLAVNLAQQKKILLQMRTMDSESKNPEIQNFKNQIVEFDKRLTLQKAKFQQKEKQIEVLKRKLEEDRQSLQKIADQLKEKQLKSKKIMDKYERSKTEIRKYREEKTEFIKKLNIQIANLNEKLQKAQKQNIELKQKQQISILRIQILEGQVAKNQGRGIQLEATRVELGHLRKQHMEMNTLISQKDKQSVQLKQMNMQLQSKRKSLLQALENPINHEMRTLDKIIRSLEKLYKEYIVTVFQQGNIIGFENKITYILSNVREIKEDLQL